VACLVAAALTGSGTRAHAVALALSLASGNAWLLGLGWRQGWGIASASVLLACAFAVLFTLPAFLLVLDPGLYAGGAQDVGEGLELLTVGVFSIITGAMAVRARVPPGGEAARAGAAVITPRAPRWTLAGMVIAMSGAALAGFLAATGGPVEHLGNLDRTGATTAGLTYLIWGVLSLKYAAFAIGAEQLAAGRRLRRWDLMLLVLALVFIAAIGARLLLIVALLQFALLVVILSGYRRTVIRALVGFSLIGALIAVGLGEFRRWQSLPTQAPFPAYLVQSGLPNLTSTYVNQYADGVRLAVMTRDLVPEEAPYEHGTGLVRALVHPIPRALRPDVDRPGPVQDAFTSPNGSGNALPLPVEGFMQAGALGVSLLGLALGAAAGIVDVLVRRGRSDVGVLLAAVAGATGLIIVLRGSLAQGVALAVMDIIGFFAVHRIITTREPARARAVPRLHPRIGTLLPRRTTRSFAARGE